MGAQRLSSPQGSVPLFLVQTGPAILTVSIAAMLLATVLTQRWVLLPVAAGGFALYWGMYLQPNHLVMDIAIALGFSDLDGRVYVDADRSPDTNSGPAGVTTSFAMRASLP